MLNSKIQDALNAQVNAEIYSSYLYLSMSTYFEANNLKGMTNWMQIQAQEELSHAMKFIDFINDRGGRVVLTAIEAPETNWDSPLAAFEQAYAHECKVTSMIGALVDLAIAESDHATNSVLQWFVTEQTEEEASAQEIVDKLKMLGDSGPGLFMLDGELAQRVFTPPAGM
jgi:ferritin